MTINEQTTYHFCAGRGCWNWQQYDEATGETTNDFCTKCALEQQLAQEIRVKQ